MKTAEELLVDLYDGFYDNIDGEPAVEDVEQEGPSSLIVRFDDGAVFRVSVETF